MQQKLTHDASYLLSFAEVRETVSYDAPQRQLIT